MLVSNWLPNNEHEHEQKKCLFVSFMFGNFIVCFEMFMNICECNTQIIKYSVRSDVFVCYIVSEQFPNRKFLFVLVRVRVRSQFSSGAISVFKY